MIRNEKNYRTEETPALEGAENSDSGSAGSSNTATAEETPIVVDDDAAKKGVVDKIKRTSNKAVNGKIQTGTALEDEIKKKVQTAEEKLGVNGKKPRKPGSGRKSGTGKTVKAKPSSKKSEDVAKQPTPPPPLTKDVNAEMINGTAMAAASFFMGMELDKIQINEEQQKTLLAVKPEAWKRSPEGEGSKAGYIALLVSYTISNIAMEYMRRKMPTPQEQKQASETHKNDAVRSE